MPAASKVVDGFHFMPPSLRSWISKDIPEEQFSGHIPWTPFKESIKTATFALMTSAGISMKSDAPFDVEREKREPLWGDPSRREIANTATEADINVNHLHINTDYIKQDINVMLPLARFREFESEGIIGRLAPTCYSYYGYQPDPETLIGETMPKVADKMREENVEAVLLTPAWPLCCRSVGLVARFLEEKGFSTLTLTMMPEFHREIGIPRVAAIEYPYGRPLGQVHDQDGQRKVLLEALAVLAKAQQPGQIFHLPFDWPEEPKKTNWHPPEMSPSVKLLLDEIKKAGAEARKKET